MRITILTSTLFLVLVGPIEPTVAANPWHGPSQDAAVPAQLGELRRSPRTPPRFADRTYVEGILQQFKDLPENTSPVERERATAKVAYYLTFLALAERLAASQAQQQSVIEEAAKADDRGAIRDAQKLRSQLPDLEACIHALENVLADRATEEDIRLVGSVGIGRTFSALYPQEDGSLRPDREAELRDRKRMPQQIVASFVGYSIAQDDRRSIPAGMKPTQAFREIEIVPLKYSARASSAELAALSEFAREGFQLQDLLRRKEHDELQKILDRRWTWILAWGDDSQADLPAAEAEKETTLLRPPLPPPNIGSQDYIQSLMNCFRSVSKTHPYSLEWARAGAKTAWYTSWIEVHNLITKLERELVEQQAELARLTDFGVKAEAETLRAVIAEKTGALVEARGALDGEPVRSPRVRQAMTRSPDTLRLYSRQSTGVWAEVPFDRPVTALAFLGKGFDRGQASQAKQDLEACQTWALMCSRNCTPGDAIELRDFSREVGECIIALEEERFEPVVRFYDSRWEWVLAWQN